jgi:CRP/FNR family transcriptional regulator, cyclic AMP receptor protein
MRSGKALLDSAGTSVTFARGETIFTQGDVNEDVLYIVSGGVKLSVRSKTGREAVVAMLGPGDCFGEACLTGQRLRTGSATAITPTAVQRVAKGRMAQLLRRNHAISDWFISQMVARNIRIEEDLIDQLFNSSEKRLARALLLLAGYGGTGRPVRVVPTISPESLAEMVGATLSRVTGLLRKFRKLGFINATQGKYAVNSSLLSVVLQD